MRIWEDDESSFVSACIAHNNADFEVLLSFDDVVEAAHGKCGLGRLIRIVTSTNSRDSSEFATQTRQAPPSLTMKIYLSWAAAIAALLTFPGTPARAEQHPHSGAEDVLLSFEASEDLETTLASFEGTAEGKCSGKCDESTCHCRSGLFGGLIVPSDQCFGSFISPITNPVFFEDPRTLTEARLIFIQHRIPLAAGGNAVQLYAIQARAALNDRLSIVASKDGFIVSQNPLIDDGWADLAVGLKYNLLANYEAQRLLSTGLSYELPVGSTRALQGNGGGEFHLYLTGAAQLGCNWHWISASGLRLPADTVDESQVWYWSNHLDRQITDSFYLLGEVNWYHWLRSGQQPALAGVEGGDLFNFGSTGVAGNDIVTGALGVKYKPSCNTEVGLAWEVPLTERRDVLDNRLTVDWILRY